MTKFEKGLVRLINRKMKEVFPKVKDAQLAAPRCHIGIDLAREIMDYLATENIICGLHLGLLGVTAYKDLKAVIDYNAGGVRKYDKVWEEYASKIAGLVKNLTEDI